MVSSESEKILSHTTLHYTTLHYTHTHIYIYTYTHVCYIHAILTILVHDGCCGDKGSCRGGGEGGCNGCSGEGGSSGGKEGLSKLVRVYNTLSFFLLSLRLFFYKCPLNF